MAKPERIAVTSDLFQTGSFVLCGTTDKVMLYSSILEDLSPTTIIPRLIMSQTQRNALDQRGGLTAADFRVQMTGPSRSDQLRVDCVESFLRSAYGGDFDM